MMRVEFKLPDGREDEIALDVEREEVEDALQLVHPGATILSVEASDPPRAPDHPDVAVRRWKRYHRDILSMCREMLDEQEVEYGGMSPREVVETAAPHFGTDREFLIRLFTKLEERIGQGADEGKSEGGEGTS